LYSLENRDREGLFLIAGHDLLDQTGEFQWEDVLGGGTIADPLERLEVLQRHGVLVDALGSLKDLLQCEGKTLCAQLLGLPLALGVQNGDCF